MRTLPAEVLDHLEQHHGVISPGQLRSLGCTPNDIRLLSRSGLLEIALQGAFRVRGQPLSRLGRLAAVCVAHPSVVIAGPSAGRFWELRRLPVEARIAVRGDMVQPVHVIAAPRAQPTVARWVVPYRTAALHPEHDVVELSDGIRLTSRSRTALDLARFVDDVDLLSIIEQTMSDGGVSIEELRSVAVDWRSPRRSWVDRFLVVLGRVLVGGPAEAHPETVLGDALVRGGLVGIVRQHGVEIPGHGTVRFDLAVPESRWALEIDVFPTHHETVGRRRDEQRDRACHAAGWTVTRIGPDAFGDALPATVDRLLALSRRLF